MKGFKGDVTIKRLTHKDYELKGDLHYCNDELCVTAKSGLVFDGASIPAFFWRVIGSPFTGKYVESACIHDALYASQGLGKVDRKEADDLFLGMMEYAGVSWWRRKAMYYAVRVGGQSAWDSIEENGKDYCEITFINNAE